MSFIRSSRSSLFIAALGAIWLAAVPVAADETTEGLLKQLRHVVENHAGHLWIGIAAEPTENGKGLIIEQVVPGSPADKAGLKKGDLITSAKGSPLKGIQDLGKVVAESKGEAFPLQITRDGKSQTMKVTPEKQAGILSFMIEGAEDDKDQDRAAKKPALQPRVQPGQPAPQMGPPGWAPAFGHPGGPNPGMNIWTHPMPPASLPEDMEVTISKKGNKPAVIKVTQGVKSWKTNEHEMGMLPPPAQAYAARMLGKPPVAPGAMMPPPGASIGGGFQWNLDLNKDRKPEGKPQQLQIPNIKQLPGGGIQIEILGDVKKEEGKKEPTKPQGNPSTEKPNPAKNPGPQVKQLPGGGIQIEIREESEGKPATEKPKKEKK